MSFTWAHQNVSSDLPELYKFYKVALKVMNQKSGQTILNLKRMAQTHTFTFMVAYSWNFSLNFYWFIASVINFYAIWHRNLCCFHVYVCLCTCVCVWSHFFSLVVNQMIYCIQIIYFYWILCLWFWYDPFIRARQTWLVNGSSTLFAIDIEMMNVVCATAEWLMLRLECVCASTTWS